MKRINLLHLLFYALSFFLPLAVYLRTLAPGLTFGDSGELITAAYYLGIPHPPGFPLWVLLTKPFTWIPYGSVAWRVNFASAFFAAGSCFLIYILLVRTTKQLASIVGSDLSRLLLLIPPLTFAFSRTLWAQAIVAEVYSLMLFSFLIPLLLLWVWLESDNARYLYLAVFASGLSIGTHYLLFTVVPALGLWLLSVERKRLFRPRRLAILSACFVLGTGIYLLLPLRAATNPPINWSHTETLAGFLKHLRRQQFNNPIIHTELNLGIYLPIISSPRKLDLLLRFFTAPLNFIFDLLQEFRSPYLLLAAASVFIYFRNKHPERQFQQWYVLLGLIILVSGIGFVLLTTPAQLALPDFSNPHLFVELLPFLALTILLGGYGILPLTTAVQQRSHPVALAGLTTVLFLLPLWQLARNYRFNDWSKNTVAYDHGMNILNTLEPNAIVFTGSNNWNFPLLYLTTVENKRPDITLYDRAGNLYANIYHYERAAIRTKFDIDVYRAQMEDKIIRENPERPAYFALDKDFENLERDLNQEGILYKAPNTPTREIDFPTFYANIYSLEKPPVQDGDTVYILAYYHLRYADLLLAQGDKKQARAEVQRAYELAPANYFALNLLGSYYSQFEDYARAEEIYRRALQVNPASADSQYNLASTLNRQGKLPAAVEAYNQAISMDPRNIKAYFDLAGIYEREKNYPKALGLFRAAGKLAPGQLLILGSLLRVSLLQGDCALAETYWQQLPQEMREVPALYTKLADCWATNGSAEKAAAFRRQAKTASPSSPASPSAKTIP